MKEIDRSFNDTVRILLSSELGGIDDYAKWLGRHIPLPLFRKSAISGKGVWIPPSFCFSGQEFDKCRIIDIEEIDQVNTPPFDEGALENVNMRDILEIINPIAYYCGNLRYKNSNNIERSSAVGGASNIYYCEDIWYKTRNVAFSHTVLYSENIFGSHMARYSKFCINIYNSYQINRGLEIDGCTNCSDVFFCHNSENLRNCILCFNVKTLSYAVGNIEVGKERYMEIKDMLISHIVEKLKKEKDFETDIFNVGCC
ncbi:MAG: hypothetical protein ABIH76_05165 [Candidatus Bathyarchaeota archaeon]